MKYSVSLTRNNEFRRLYSKGKSAASPSMVVYCRRTTYIPRGKARDAVAVIGRANRIGFTVSTKLGGAVTRNRIRRRLREAYRLNEHLLLRGFDIVIVARAAALDADFSALNGEFRRICRRLGMIEKKPLANAASAVAQESRKNK